MKPPNRSFLIAITGGIASGKTLFCQELVKKGFSVYYSDNIVHSILEEEKIRLKIIKNFGKEILDETGRINRKLLGDLVFNNPGKLSVLNKIIHPEVRKKIQQIIDSSKEKYLFFEIPLLVEKGLQKAFDLTINIHADEKLRIERLLQGRAMDKVKAGKIIRSQINSELRGEKTDLTIINNGELKMLFDQVDSLIEELRDFPFKTIVRITDINQQ